MYPPTSVATSGTHDTEPLIVWWERAPEDERKKISQLPAIRRLSNGADIPRGAYNAGVRDILLEALFSSGSDLLLLPMQDVFGWRDRINQPATVSDHNWTYRLPWASDKLDQIPEARERKAQLRAWSQKYGRNHG